MKRAALSFFQPPTGAIRAAIVTGGPKLDIDNNVLQGMIQRCLHLYWLWSFENALAG
jgi:hypothetical protein